MFTRIRNDLRCLLWAGPERGLRGAAAPSMLCSPTPISSSSSSSGTLVIRGILVGIANVVSWSLGFAQGTCQWTPYFLCILKSEAGRVLWLWVHSIEMRTHWAPCSQPIRISTRIFRLVYTTVWNKNEMYEDIVICVTLEIEAIVIRNKQNRVIDSHPNVIKLQNHKVWLETWYR